MGRGIVRDTGGRPERRGDGRSGFGRSAVVGKSRRQRVAVVRRIALRVGLVGRVVPVRRADPVARRRTNKTTTTRKRGRRRKRRSRVGEQNPTRKKRIKTKQSPHPPPPP